MARCYRTDLLKLSLPVAIQIIVLYHILIIRWGPSVSNVDYAVVEEGSSSFYQSAAHTDNTTRYMDVGYSGRLGNIMFEYAALYCIARHNGFVPIVYEQSEIFQTFRELDCQVSPNSEPGIGFDEFAEEAVMKYDNRTLKLHVRQTSVHLFGHYQSYKYCHQYRQEIKQQFAFTPMVELKTGAFLKSLHDTYDTSKVVVNESLTYIGVHIRRGDYIKHAKLLRGHVVVDAVYTKEAMGHFTKKFPNAVFVVVTDDTTWAKKHVKSNPGNQPIVFSPFREAIEDMCLLSKCNHTIMSTGTFSWWAAWLAGGQAVYAGEYPIPGTFLGNICKREDYYMPHWVPL